ncbi:MAG: hypothetical protein KAR64_01800 [Thermoplasmatales archaeon]|nr:hypothetical protein [Thermoplasmatales archaeon]
MRQNILLKSLVFGIVLLFVLTSSQPNINAVNLTEQSLMEFNSDIDSSITESSDMSLDIAILDIIPYLWPKERSIFGELHLTLKIKNVGNVPVQGVKYYGNSTYYINNKKYGSAWGGLLLGVLDPGEEWIPQSSAGLYFVNFVPRIFNLEYEIFPMDSNPDNNYIRQVYLARGGRIIPFCKRIPLLE